MNPDDPTTPQGNPIESVLAQQANAAIASGKDPKKVSDRLGTMVRHLRSNPDVSQQANAALAHGKDPVAVGRRVLDLASDGQFKTDMSGVRSDISQRDQQAQTPVQNDAGSTEGILDRGLDVLTGGLHPKILGVGNAIGDVLQHGLNAHPIDSFNAGDHATRSRMDAAKRVHPTASTAADATGFFGALASGGALADMLGLSQAAPATRLANGLRETAPEATGALAAAKRIGTAAKTGAGIGAITSGLASEGDLSSRAGQTAVGGILGGLFGGGAQSVGEVGGAAVSKAKQLFRSSSSKGEDLALRQIGNGLLSDGLTPDDLLANAKTAQQLGVPSRVAHLGGPSLDAATYLGVSSRTPEGSALKQSLKDAQRSEHDVLQSGITAMSGRDNTPKNQAANFIRSLEDAQAAAGAVDYPKAYASPAVTDPRILDAIAHEPYLSGSLDKSVDILNRKGRAAALRSGQPSPEVLNPLTQREAAPSGIETQLASLYSHDPIKLAIARQKAGLPPEPVSASGSIPIQMLDKLQQAAQPGIERGLAQGHLAAEDAGAIHSQIQSILRMADESNPEFQAARARQASFFGRTDGARAGQTALDKSGPAITQAMAELSRPGQQEAYRTTATSKLRDLINANNYGADLGKVFDSPESEGQLDALYGAGARDRLDPYLEQGSILNRVLQSATGNSSTEARAEIRRSAVDGSSGALAHALASPLQTLKKIPGQLEGAANRKTQQALYQSLARQLNIPADSPELPRLVDALLSSAPSDRVTTATSGRRQAIAQGAGLLGSFLSHGSQP